MPETGVYVIREEDHGILYFNRRVQEVSPEVRLPRDLVRHLQLLSPAGYGGQAGEPVRQL